MPTATATNSKKIHGEGQASRRRTSLVALAWTCEGKPRPFDARLLECAVFLGSGSLSLEMKEEV